MILPILAAILVNPRPSSKPPMMQALPFSLSDVHLMGGPFAQANKVCVDYLLSVDPDRLLHSFRIHSGLAAKGKIYGGWEDSGLDRKSVV